MDAVVREYWPHKRQHQPCLSGYLDLWGRHKDSIDIVQTVILNIFRVMGGRAMNDIRISFPECSTLKS